jgi:cytochrome c biogenesis protein CcdA
VSLLLFAYLIVAFVAGVVALAMPCCFSVLLPSYFAQSFKQTIKLVGMTIVFSIGIATIMLPIAMGVLAVARAITGNHGLIFVTGGFIMILLGFWTLWGKGMFPQLSMPVDLNRNNVATVYTLGIFSGAATSCCAPVLAGVLVLTALSTSFVQGLLIGFAYVAGMVSPLFLVALLWEKYAASGENPFRGRMVHLRYFGREFSIHSSKLIAGGMFTVMGVVTVILGLTGTMIPTPGSALIGVMQAQLADALQGFFSNAGASETAALFSGALTLIGTLYLVRNRMKRTRPLRSTTVE